MVGIRIEVDGGATIGFADGLVVSLRMGKAWANQRALQRHGAFEMSRRFKRRCLVDGLPLREEFRARMGTLEALAHSM